MLSWMQISSLSSAYTIGAEILKSVQKCSFSPSSPMEILFNSALLPYSQDLRSSVQFDEHIYADPQLFPLQFNVSDASKRINALRSEPIRTVQVGSVIYVDLRYWGYDCYDELDVLNAYVIMHVVACEYLRWRTHRRYRFVQVPCSVFDEILRDWDDYDVHVYGGISDLSVAHTLVNVAFCALHLHVLPDRNRDRLIAHYST